MASDVPVHVSFLLSILQPSSLWYRPCIRRSRLSASECAAPPYVVTALYPWISVSLVSCHYWVMNLYFFAPCLVGTWYLKCSASNYFYESTEMGIHTFSMTARDDWYEVVFKLFVPANRPSTLHPHLPMLMVWVQPGEFLHIWLIPAVISGDEHSLAHMHSFLLPRVDWPQRAPLSCPFPGSCY